MNYLNACNEAEKSVPQSAERDALIEFIRSSQRGVIKPYTSK
jgi:UDP-N-acetylglucosamine acyltransferase